MPIRVFNFVTRRCLFCKKKFVTRQSKIDQGRGKYCSRFCMKPSRPLAVRFWEKVSKRKGKDACWIWTAGVGKKGYGSIASCDGRGNLAAHRASWEIHFGAPSDDICVLHTCDNPACVRPSHLFLGTNSDNVRDKMSKGRHKVAIGQKHWNSKLVDAQVLQIRSDYGSGLKTRSQLADEYKVDYYTIDAIVKGRLWKHLL